ncbi:OmpA family protein [Sulfitobacter sp. D35]|uniref:OmpA family protein n=1 Tax=Sulfitobacter sp. D35 TaxID=3083252 RepID=UPI00296FDD26|nr:OmpA family protein [Sulfitobacter sp. D35]MDW4500394.1 OmpA family protein [Sulfitobacter sp. D35]
MRLSIALFTGLSFAAAAGLSYVTANASVQFIEDNTEIEVRDTLDEEGLTWAEVEADGLRVIVAGTAPTEALRFRALSTVGSMVDAARLVDEMEVEATAAIDPPRFSAEILRNDSGFSVIGLIPQSTDREALIEAFDRLSDEPVADLLETADYPAPSGWQDAVAFATNAMRDLPRAKVSIASGNVSITAITDSEEDKQALEEKLRRAQPPGLYVTLAISAPRPVITPFTLRFVIDEAGRRFDACSADTEDSQQRILDAAMAAGLTGPGRCTIGMGVPSPNWSDAAVTAIAALAELGAGSVTFSNADVTLTAAPGTEQALFDRVVGELQNDLPEVFALHADLPKLEDPSAGPPEFVATLSPEGQVQLRGRISDEEMLRLADSFAKSRFGSGNVYTATRIVEDLPEDWQMRVLTGLEALGELGNGAVSIQPELVRVTGSTGDPDASAELARLLAARLGDAARFEIDVAYKEEYDPVALAPTPERCEEEIAGIVAVGKINFEPGSATIDATALKTMDEIADVLKECGDLPIEIQGHTDSQGREEMNLALSQARAESVINELRARRVLTGSFVAVGYGETQPVADNGTEDGREENRRIEFHLIRPDTVTPTGETTLESLAENGDTGAEPDAAASEETDADADGDSAETETADGDAPPSSEAGDDAASEEGDSASE